MTTTNNHMYCMLWFEYQNVPLALFAQDYYYVQISRNLLFLHLYFLSFIMTESGTESGNRLNLLIWGYIFIIGQQTHKTKRQPVMRGQSVLIPIF